MQVVDNHTPHRTLLQTASNFGLHEVAQMLLELGASPVQLDDFGNSALSLAVDSGHLDTFAVLMDYLGLHQLPSGLTFRAAMTGNPEMVKLVLQAGSMVDERDMFGRTALHACTQPHRLAGGREFYEVCLQVAFSCVLR